MSAMDPALCGLSPPMRVGLVAQVIRQEPDLGGTLMEGINPQQRFVVSPSIQEIGLITLFNAMITAAAPLPRLLLDARSGWVRHSRPTFGDFFQLRELCAGIGGFSQGANFVGIKTVACLDHSALACAALRLQGHYTIQADIEDQEALQKLHAAGNARLPGYYKRLASSLECVHNVKEHPDVTLLLQEYARGRNWQSHATTLDLQDQWASRRKRWWCIMIPNDDRVPFRLLPWPASNPFPNVGSVIQEWPIWPDEDEDNLAWYGNLDYGKDLRHLNLAAPAPTALHSWGFAIISMSTGKKRYIHPKAVWIFAHVTNWIFQIHAKRPGRSALGYVHEYQHKLLRDRLLHWITPSMFRSRTLTLKEEGEPDVLITLKSPASLAQVKAAETALQGWGAAVHVHPTGHIQTDQELIASATDRLHCQINRQKKRQAIAFPESEDKRPLRAAGPETAELTWDETAVLYNLQLILNYAACIDPRPWGIITPVQAFELLCATPRALPNELQLFDRAVIIFPYNNHWTLLTLEPSEDHTLATYWDAPATPNQQAAHDLTLDICSLMGWPSPHIQHKHIFATTSNGNCGVLAIVHFGWHLDLWDHLPDERIMQWHLAFATTPSGPCLRELKAVLITKGVPQAAVQSRAEAKLGIGPIQAALRDKNNWQALKALASRPASRFRWIDYNELQDHIAERANSKFGTNIPNAKGKKLKGQGHAGRPPSLQVDPNQLVIPEGIFADDENNSIAQIAFSDIGCNKRGFAITTVEDAMHFIKDAQSISTEALALITTTELPPHQQAETIRFPAVYTGTNEPILLTGSLTRYTSTLRISVFADEYPQVIQDVWSWTYATLDGRRSNTEHCDPWFNGSDPWAKWFHTSGDVDMTPSASALPATSTKKIDQLGTTLKTDMHEAVRSEVAKSTDVAKITHLEASVHELREQGKRFENWFHEVSQRSQQQDDDLKALKHVVTQQQGDLAEVKHQIKSQGDSLQAAVGTIKNDLSNQIDSQFQRFEALLAKKARMESLSIFSLLSILLCFGLFPLGAAHAENEQCQPGTQLYYVSAKELYASSYCDQGPRESTLKAQHPGRAACSAAAPTLTLDANYRRIGEARNPGPSNPLPPTEELLVVGTTNPSGLNGKEEIQINQDPGIWLLAETQLSYISGPTSRKRLAALGRAHQRQVRCIEGAPAPLRANSLWAGSWSGVMMISDFPAQAITLPWEPGAFETGRVATGRHFIDDLPITTTVVYGFAQGPTYPNAKALTDQLLTTVTKEVVLGMQGVRIIAGDFNMTADSSPQIAIWRQHGWQEAQQLAHSLWQQPPQPTCKGATTPDMLFLSPEAAALVLRVRVEDVYMEHSSVMVDLWTKPQQRLLRQWRQPASIPWESVRIPQWHAANVEVANLEQPATEWYREFAATYENSLNGFVSSFGHNELPRRCKGRAKWSEPHQTKLTSHILKSSRPGEEAILTSLAGTAVRQWCKQLRRLQSYTHATATQPRSANSGLYIAQLWGAITRSSGFRGSFHVWWKTRPAQLQGSPVSLPLDPPAHQQAILIFQDFRTNYRQFEAWHANKRRQAINLKFEESTGVLYNFIKEDKAPPIDTLAIARDYTILAVDPSNNFVHLDKVIYVKGSSSWSLHGEPAHVQLEAADIAQVDSDRLLCPGDTLEQNVSVTHIDDIHHELLELWSSRWNTTAQLSEAEFQRIANFIHAFIPRGHFPCEPISVNDWDIALKKYRPHTAKGPDAFALNDLRNMHPAHKANLIGWLNRLEEGQSAWPTQVLQGTITPVAKTTNSKEPDSYRPITVYSLVYRTWAAVRTKTILKSISYLLSNTAYGFMPEKEALQYVFAIQALVELSAQADHASGGVCGFAADLKRCFNNLRREPITLTAQALGVSNRVLKPWLGFLYGNQRRFTVRGHLSEPTKSSVGYPEGCPLSVAAMTMIDLSFHLYMKAFCPSVTSYSFVDNLAATATSTQALARGWCTMEAFCSLFKLPVDYDKSFAWASAPGDRKALELFPCRAVRAARDLGGTLSFGGTLRNSSLVERCRGLAGRWNALKRAPGSLINKARTLWTCFWPRALHGIVTCRLGDQHIKQLRSAAVAALQLKCAGGNPILRLTLEFQCMADPGYYQIATTLRDFRRLCHKQPAHVNEWAHFMRQYDGRLLPGPFSKLIEVCSSLGWTITSVPIIQDHDGVNFNLLMCATNELDIRLNDAWAQHIAGQVRKSMNGLRGLDLACTTRRRSKYNPLQARLVAAIWDGSFRAVCYHAKYDLTKDAQCPRCHVTDDYRHQVAVCPRFHSCQGEDQWAADIWDTLPECISQHLLIPRNPMLADIKKALGDLPDRSTEFHLLPNDQDWDTFGASKLPELPLGFVKQFLTWILKLDEQCADSTDVSYL
ncbi:unnamed protein product, partial [Effrenium voratum]